LCDGDLSKPQAAGKLGQECFRKFVPIDMCNQDCLVIQRMLVRRNWAMDEIADAGQEDVILDALPDDVVSTIEARDKHMAEVGPQRGLGFEFLFSDLQRWVPGQVIRVAFLGGETALHHSIMDATQEIAEACNLLFDYGAKPDGSLRRWAEADTSYSAEIRISFDEPGYFSLVGTDSVNPGIGSPRGPVGGRPGQRSLNLGGFTVARPATWRTTVLHELLHALAFHHSHQNMRGPCKDEFRWEDDTGYQQTLDANGAYVADPQGRRPGIYTYLSGYPNRWSREKVDSNLLAEEKPNLVAGPFDRSSVMLYRFPEIFYKSLPSPCAPLPALDKLSEGDRRGLQLLYPKNHAGAAAIVAKQTAIMRALEGPGADMASENNARFDPQVSHAVVILRRNFALREARNPGDDHKTAATDADQAS
jgi:hypothetical protein